MNIEELRSGLWQWFTEGVAEGASNAGAHVALVGPGGVGLRIPIEWGQAKRLADILGEPVRLVNGEGSVTLEYHPVR